MSEPFVGEIKMFAGGFAPRGWAFCDGQMLAVSQNDILFSLFGTTYGGDGRTEFGLPDMRGRIPVHGGQGPGLTNRNLGDHYGYETVNLTKNQMAEHSHNAQASNDPSSSRSISGYVLARGVNDNDKFFVGGQSVATGQLVPGTIGDTGGSQPHTNMMPALCINFIVALTGVYPSRH